MKLSNRQLNDSSTPNFFGQIIADTWYKYELTFHAPSKNAAKDHWKVIVNEQMSLISGCKKIKIKFKQVK